MADKTQPAKPATFQVREDRICILRSDFDYLMERISDSISFQDTVEVFQKLKEIKDSL